MNKKRLVYIDVIRVFAMVLVVLSHSCATVLGSKHHNLNWSVANSLVIITEVAVPLFFMISGSTILNSQKTYSLKYLFRHRLVRIMVPFLVWSVISAFGYSMINHHTALDPWERIMLIYHQPVLIAYWFIYPLITLYLLSPLLKAMVSRVDDGMLTYLLVIWMIFNIILPQIVNNTPHSIGVYFDIYPMGRIIFSRSLGYFILGYRVTRGKHRRINPWLNSLLIIVLMTVNVVISFVTIDKSLRFWNVLAAINMPIIVVLIYLSLRALEPHYPRWFASMIEAAAPTTYGVYLMHGIVIFTVQEFVKPTNFGYIFALTLVVCVLAILILSHIPFVRRVFT